MQVPNQAGLIIAHGVLGPLLGRVVSSSGGGGGGDNSPRAPLARWLRDKHGVADKFMQQVGIDLSQSKSTGVALAGHAFKAVGILLNSSSRYESAYQYVRAQDLMEFEGQMPFLVSLMHSVFLGRGLGEVVYEDDWSYVFKIPLSGGTTSCWLSRRKGAGDKGGDNGEIYYKVGELGKVFTGLRSGIWEYFRGHLSGGDNGGVSAYPICVLGYDYHGNLQVRVRDISEYRYIGQAADHYAGVWAKFLAAGLTRQVLLHGEPGGGKTTFCYDVCRRVFPRGKSPRVLELGNDFCEEARPADWHVVLDLLRPDVLVINDIDRVGGEILGKRLGVFERGGQQGKGYRPALTLMTSNSLAPFPPAMLRPGRVDQVLVMGSSGGVVSLDRLPADPAIDNIPPRQADVLREVCGEICREEGGYQYKDAGEEAVVLGISARLSVAHAREYIRRLRILGAAAGVPGAAAAGDEICDITFTGFVTLMAHAGGCDNSGGASPDENDETTNP